MTKMTFIIKSGLKGNFLDGIRRFLKEKLCNGQSLFENQFGEGYPVKINYLGYYTSNVPLTDDTWAEQILEKEFNLDITCFPTYLYSDMSYLYDQELIRDIPEEWLWEYYPTGMEIYENFLGKEFFEEGKHLVDGKLLCIPRITVYNGAMKTVYFRQDWLDNLGLSEPTTLDELHDVLYAFTYDDPDGNG